MSEPRSCTALRVVWASAAPPNPTAAASARSGIIFSMNSLDSVFGASAAPELKRDGLLDDHLGADRNAAVEVDHVLVDQTEAARRDRGSDRLRLVGPMDAIDGGAEIHRARPERIARSAGHEPRQGGLAFNHFRRRAPVRPFLLARNLLQAGPLEAIAADADAVAQRPIVRLHQIEEPRPRIDHDRAWRLGGAEEHLLLFKSAGELLFFRRRLIAGLVDHTRFVLA